MTKVAVILSGCGVNDGSEIHEAVLTLLALDRGGATVTCAAPNVQQADVIDHATGKPASPAAKDKRNVLTESARIARGEIQDLATLDAGDFDAVVLPGGYGAAKNLCTFAKGKDPWTVQQDVAKFLQAMRRANKPIGAICIAPAVIAALFGKDGVELTIGTDPATAKRIESTGATHVACRVDQIAIDAERRIVTTPAYMLATRIGEAAAGIDKLVQAVLRMAR